MTVLTLLAGLLATASMGDAEQLIALDKELLRATVRKDRAVLQKLYAEEFVLVDSDGMVIGKRQNIDEICAPDVAFQVLEGDRYEVQLYGHAATMTHGVTIEGRAPDGPFGGRSKAVHAFVKRDGRWQVLFTLDADQD